MRTSRKERVHQRCSVFGERPSRINIIPHETVTSTASLVRKIDITNRMTRCNCQCQSVIWPVFDLTGVYVPYYKLFFTIHLVPHTMKALCYDLHQWCCVCDPRFILTESHNQHLDEVVIYSPKYDIMTSVNELSFPGPIS
jgi:hypothetical protein